MNSSLSKYEKNSESEEGRKLQTTVRLEPTTFSEVDKLMLAHGTSRAEIIRRLVKIGLEKVMVR